MDKFAIYIIMHIEYLTENIQITTKMVRLPILVIGAIKKKIENSLIIDQHESLDENGIL